MREALPVIAVAAALVLIAVFMPALAPLFKAMFPDVVPPVFQFLSFPRLLLAHAEIAAAASAAATAAALVAGIIATRERGRAFRPIVGASAAIGQTFPPVAVLAVAVPVLGYGELPTFVALALYGFMPVVANVLAGIDSVPPSIKEAARGMGFGPTRILIEVELPLAAPAILAGIRTMVAITIGTATIGSTVGAVTLGTPIIDGLVAGKLPYVIEGAVVVGLFAILADMALERLERHVGAWRRR
ncbi:MAG: ABC transporter permease [Stellaceae bacterium]